MLSGITTTCFAASYFVALVLEVSRTFYHFRARKLATIIATVAGLFAHTIYLASLFRSQAAEGLPLITWYTGCLLIAWVLCVPYLILLLFPRHSTSGLLLLPTCLVMIVVAHVFPKSTQALRIWGLLHGLSLAFGIVVVVTGFLAALLYLYQSRRLKQKLPPIEHLWLPSLERLQKKIERCLIISAILVGTGLISGILINLARGSSDLVIPWFDPVVIASMIWLAWLIAIIVFHTTYRRARHGRKVAFMSIGSFACLGVVLSIIWWMPSGHSSSADHTQIRSLDVNHRLIVTEQIRRWS